MDTGSKNLMNNTVEQF